MILTRRDKVDRSQRIYLVNNSGKNATFLEEMTDHFIKAGVIREDIKDRLNIVTIINVFSKGGPANLKDVDNKNTPDFNDFAIFFWPY